VTGYIWSSLIYTFKWANLIYTVYAGFYAARYFALRRKEIKGQKAKEREKKFLEKYIFILRALPIILLVGFIPPTVSRMYTFITQDVNFYLDVLHLSMYTLLGFFNSLAYSYFYRSLFRCKRTEICGLDNSTKDTDKDDERDDGKDIRANDL
jgi:hypothetical protein